MAVMTRGVLYRRIDAMRKKYGIKGRFDPFAIEEAQGSPVQYHAFSDSRLQGVLIRSSGSSGVILDPRLTPEQQRLTLTHELVHRELHYGESGTAFQDHSGMEYQADEGAAELLMPYRALIPRAVSFRRRYREDPVRITALLAAHYRVDCETMRKRLDSLDRELMLYIRGTPLSEIVPLSRQELQKQGHSSREFGQPHRKTTLPAPDIFPEEE